MKEYFLSINGKKTGPFTFQELKERKIYRQTQVWDAEEGDWYNAESFSELRHIITVPGYGDEYISPSHEIEDIPDESENPPVIAPEAGARTINNFFGYEPASLLQRFLGALVNGFFIYIIVSIVTALFKSLGVPNPYAGSPTDNVIGQMMQGIITNFVITIIIAAIIYPRVCGNLGHAVMGIKVISALDGKDYEEPIEGVKREALKSLLGFLFIPSIWLLFDSKSQNLYEKIAKTFVVKKKKE